MLSNTGVRYGLLGGVVVVFYFVLLYAISPNLFVNLLLQWSSLVFYLVFMWQATKMDCLKNGLSRDFRELLRTPFVVFLLINLFYWLLFYALHLYDVNLGKAETAMAIAHIKAQIESGPGDPVQANILRNNLIDLEKSLLSPQPQPLGQIINSMFIGALGGFGLSAAITAIFRSKA